MTDPTVPRPLNASRGTQVMVAGAAVAALAAYGFQFLGGRALGREEFAPIAVLWTLQFLVFTIILVPTEQLTIRRLAMEPDHPLRRDLPLIGATVGSAAVIVGAGLWLWRDQFVDGHGVHALQGVLIVLGYGVFAFGRGRLAGLVDYTSYGLATGAESLLRLSVALVMLMIATDSQTLGWAMVVGPLVILAWRPFRHVGGDAPHVPVENAGGFLVSFVIANGASNVILAAGPLAVDALGASNAVVSQFFITLILLRAPFTFAYGLMARVLTPMAKLVSEGRGAELDRLVWRMVLVGLAASIAGAVGGRVLGPFAIELLFGDEFRPRALVASLILAGVGAALASLALTQILVARGETGRLAVAWLIALAAAAAAIAVASGTPDVRVAIGFLTGQVVALAGVAVASRAP